MVCIKAAMHVLSCSLPVCGVHKLVPLLTTAPVDPIQRQQVVHGHPADCLTDADSQAHSRVGEVVAASSAHPELPRGLVAAAQLRPRQHLVNVNGTYFVAQSWP